MSEHVMPKVIDGVVVEESGDAEVMHIQGHVFHTMIPTDEEDVTGRIWEWDEITGKTYAVHDD